MEKLARKMGQLSSFEDGDQQSWFVQESGRGGKVGGHEPRSCAKIKFCMYYLQGVCCRTAESCSYAHSVEEMRRPRDDRRRTRRPQAQKGKDGMLSQGQYSPAGNIEQSSNDVSYNSRGDPIAGSAPILPDQGLVPERVCTNVNERRFAMMQQDHVNVDTAKPQDDTGTHPNWMNYSSPTPYSTNSDSLVAFRTNAQATHVDSRCMAALAVQAPQTQTIVADRARSLNLMNQNLLLALPQSTEPIIDAGKFALIAQALHSRRMLRALANQLAQKAEVLQTALESAVTSLPHPALGSTAHSSANCLESSSTMPDVSKSGSPFEDKPLVGMMQGSELGFSRERRIFPDEGFQHEGFPPLLDFAPPGFQHRAFDCSGSFVASPPGLHF
eukprot:TRINITY_DN8414_c0_g1_i1.p1 TRINITY_DN8414_c0_g1~~TRINITY_DN8414_c0_g1_i1.p1  ORF type:complete len:385 (+),score=33.25 TRINITY_DN8414_c0_g1_i1:87-1241(+)